MARWRLPDGVKAPKRPAGRDKRLTAINLGETLFMQHCLDAGLPHPLTQHLFATSIKNKKSGIGRKWRWDFCWPEIMLAVEINGGIFMNGAHGNPMRILDNMDKLNHGALLGWHVLAFTPDQVLKSTYAIDFTVKVLKARGVSA